MGSPSPAPDANKIYHFGAFTLDPEERLLLRGKQPVPLPPRVFDTLLILVANAGSLVRKSELMDFVWPGARVEEVNLAHNISDLRRVLGASGIQTVPKHGYRFVEPVAKIPRNPLPEPEMAELEPPRARPSIRFFVPAAAVILVVSIALILGLFRRSAAPGADAIKLRLARNPQAVQYYLKGRYFFDRRSSQDFDKSIEMYRKAIDADPKYAQAYAGLAEALAFASKPAEQIHAALDRALALDPDLAEAHALVALNAMNGEWNWPKAEREFRRAIQLNANLTEAHQWYGDFLGYMGRFDESASELNAAIALDPLSPILWSDKCEMLTLSRRFSDAIAACRYVLDMYPDYFIAHYQLVDAYILNRQPREALETARAAVGEDRRAIAVARLAQAYASAAEPDQAHALIRQLAASGEDRTVPFELARCYAILGETGTALDWLEKSRAMGAALMIGLKMDPLLGPLRAEPRFHALLNGMNLAD